MTAEQFVDGVWQITDDRPETIDAAVVRSDGRGADPQKTDVTANWIWRDVINNPDAPIEGEWLVFKRTINLASPIKYGVAAVCGDNEFEMYIDDVEVGASDDWMKVTALPLHGLSAGEHEILVVVRSYLQIRERSGLFFQAEYQLADGTEHRLVSDLDWEFTRRHPRQLDGRISDVQGPWNTPIKLTRPILHTQFVVNRTREIMAKGIALRELQPRASLMKSDKLQSTLDRPLRNIVVPQRPRTLSKHQWAELINGDTIDNQVTAGAKHLIQRDGQGAKLLNNLYLQALGRLPTRNELVAISEFSKGKLSEDTVQDVLWSVLMLPEFMTVR